MLNYEGIPHIEKEWEHIPINESEIYGSLKEIPLVILIFFNWWLEVHWIYI